MHTAEGMPARILLLSPDFERWAPRYASLLPPGSEVLPGSGELPPLAGFDAVVLQSQPALGGVSLAQIGLYVDHGGQLLAVDVSSDLEGLLGVRPDERLPAAEFFVKVADPEHELTRRLRSEFAIVDAFSPLEVVQEGVEPLLAVNVHFKDRLVMAERRLGQGRVIVSALGARERAFESADLRSVLRRGLRRRNESVTRSQLGVAIVGYGPPDGMGFRHGLGVRATTGLRLVAICDTNETRLTTAGESFPEASLYATATEAASDPEVDIAIIATPPASHTAVSLEMLRAGKHVVCEKPLCFTASEADQLIETALEHGLALTVHQNRRWDADFLSVRRAIDAGLLGQVFNVETFVGSFEHPCREWHSDSLISGGAEYDWGAHYIDWILQLIGSEPSLVYATGHKRVWHDVTNLDQMRVRMIWEDGREAEFVHSDVAAVRRPKFYIQGTEGTLVGHYRPLVSERIEPGLGYTREESHHAEAPADLTLVRFEPLGEGLREQHLSLARTEAFPFHRNLADHLLANDEPLAVDYRQSRALIAVLEAAHSSAASGGQPVRPA